MKHLNLSKTLLTGLLGLLALVAVSCGGGENSGPSGQSASADRNEQNAQQQQRVTEEDINPLTVGDFEVIAYNGEGIPSQQLTDRLEGEIETQSGERKLVLNHEEGTGKQILAKVNYDGDQFRHQHTSFSGKLATTANTVTVDVHPKEGEVALVMSKLRPDERESVELGGEIAEISFTNQPDTVRKASQVGNNSGPIVVINPDDPSTPGDGVDETNEEVDAELRLVGDTNADESIGFGDITTVIDNFGLGSGDQGFNMARDPADDDVIDFSDITAVINAFGISVTGINEFRGNSEPVSASGTPATTHDMSEVRTGNDATTSNGWQELAIPFDTDQLPNEDVFVAYTAEINLSGESDVASETVQVKQGEITSNTWASDFEITAVNDKTGNAYQDGGNDVVITSGGMSPSDFSVPANSEVDFELSGVTVRHDPDGVGGNSPNTINLEMQGGQLVDTSDSNPVASNECAQGGPWGEDFCNNLLALVGDDSNAGSIVFDLEPSGDDNDTLDPGENFGIADVNGLSRTGGINAQWNNGDASSSLQRLLVTPHTGTGSQTISPQSQFNFTVTVPGIRQGPNRTLVDFQVPAGGSGSLTVDVTDDPEAPTIEAISVASEQGSTDQNGAVSFNSDDVRDVILDLQLTNAVASAGSNETDCASLSNCNGDRTQSPDLRPLDITAFPIDDTGSFDSVDLTRAINFKLPHDGLRPGGEFDPTTERSDSNGEPQPQGWYELPGNQDRDNDGDNNDDLRLRFPVENVGIGDDQPDNIATGAWVLVVSNNVFRDDGFTDNARPAHPSSGFPQGTSGSLSHDGRTVSAITTGTGTSGLNTTTWPFDFDGPPDLDGGGGDFPTLFVFPEQPEVTSSLNPANAETFRWREDASERLSWMAASSNDRPVVVVREGGTTNSFQLLSNVQTPQPFPSGTQGRSPWRYAINIGSGLSGTWDYRIVPDAASPGQNVIAAGQFEGVDTPGLANESDPNQAEVVNFGRDSWNAGTLQNPDRSRDLDLNAAAFGTFGDAEKTFAPSDQSPSEAKTWLVAKVQSFAPEVNFSTSSRTNTLVIQRDGDPDNGADDCTASGPGSPGGSTPLDNQHVIRPRANTTDRIGYVLAEIPSESDLGGLGGGVQEWCIGVETPTGSTNWNSVALTIDRGA